MTKRLLIRGGTVINGRPRTRPRHADILVSGERIERIGRNIEACGATVLDATGATVTPGFIDVHTHSDITALIDSSAQCRVYQGVTSELNGSCGFSLFPLTGPAAADRRRALAEDGIEAEWTSAEEYFSAVEARGSAINRAFFAGHGTIRTSVMGYSGRRAGRRQIERMERLLSECLEQGACGMSSGLCYPPGCFGDRREITTLCRVAARFGRPYTTHMRSEGRAVLGSVRETIAVGRASGAPIHISHLKVAGRQHWWKFDRLRKIVHDARAEGVDLTADRYPYLASQTGLFTLLPERVMSGGREKALKRIREPRRRKELQRLLKRRLPKPEDWERIVVARASGDAEPFVGLNLAQVAERLDLQAVEAFFEILLRGDMSVSAVFFNMSEAHLEEILSWPFVSVGSDSSARSLRGSTAQGRPHPRTFGCFARYLSEYVLRRQVLSMPEAVAKITSRSAQRFGLRDRGELKPGLFADIAVFEPENLSDRATYQKPFRLARGMRHVLVNGQPVLKNGRATRARPGRVLRCER